MFTKEELKMLNNLVEFAYDSGFNDDLSDDDFNTIRKIREKLKEAIQE